MCWFKSPAAGTLSAKTNCTSGSVPRTSPPPPPPPAPSKYWVPALNFVKTIAEDPAGNMRDPSAAVQDPVTKKWHFWVDHMNGSTQPGWYAYIHHYSAPEILGPWVSHGLALPHSNDPNAWDNQGTFSSSVIYSAEEERWYMFYSASGANQTALHTCAQLVASAKSPDGPWTKLTPAVAIPTGAPPGWTGGWNTRRLDSGRALVIGGKRGYWTKGVSGTNVASEGLYLPHNPSTWEPPYAEWSHNPLFAEQPSWDPSGYENCEFFRGPPVSDTDELHVWCSFHGGRGEPGLPLGPAPHFVIDLKSDPQGLNWTYAGALNPHNASDHGPAPGEPTPVYEGVPGDAATVRYFIARHTTGKRGAGELAIGLYSLSWIAPGTPPDEAGRWAKRSASL